MKIEVCADSLTTAKIADQYGVDRVELCAALSVGGLTPGLGLVEACVNETNLEIHAMIRHREGGFVYDRSQRDIMKTDIGNVSKIGVSGVVFGYLTPSRQIDIETSRFLIETAKDKGLEVTFHRAFDFVDEPFEALEKIIDMGVDRLLTSGQKTKAEDGLKLIEALVKQSQQRIEIMAGSGVNTNNALKIANSGVDALHFTAHYLNISDSDNGMGQRTITDELKIKAMTDLFK